MTAPIDPALTGQVSTALGPMFVAAMMSPASSERFGAVGFDQNDVMERYFAFRAGTTRSRHRRDGHRHVLQLRPPPHPSLHPAGVGHRGARRRARRVDGRRRRDDGRRPRRLHRQLRADRARGAAQRCGGRGVRAPRGPAAVRRDRRHPVARRPARAGVARHARVARVPGRRPPRRADLAWHQRPGGARAPHRDGRLPAGSCSVRRATGPTKRGTRRSSRCGRGGCSWPTTSC